LTIDVANASTDVDFSESVPKRFRDQEHESAASLAVRSVRSSAEDVKVGQGLTV
jgi:hypothetical protein